MTLDGSYVLSYLKLKLTNNMFWIATNRTRLRRMAIAFGSFSHVGTNVIKLDSNFVSVFAICIDTFVYCVFAHFSRNSEKRTWVLDKKKTIKLCTNVI